MFIYVIHQNILWNCQCNLMQCNGYHVVNVKSWSCVHMHFRFFTLTRYSVAVLLRWGGCMQFIPAHVPFIVKSNSENYIKIRWFLIKLQRKISWLFLWPMVYISPSFGTVSRQFRILSKILPKSATCKNWGRLPPKPRRALVRSNPLCDIYPQ